MIINSFKFYRAAIYKYNGEENNVYGIENNNYFVTKNSILKRFDTVYKFKKDGKYHYISVDQQKEYKTSNDIKNLKVGEEFINLSHKLVPIRLYYMKNRVNFIYRYLENDYNIISIGLYFEKNRELEKK